MKQKMLWIIAGIVLLIGGWFGSAIAAELKVGCVDIQRAVNECNAGKEAKKEIIKEMQKLQRLAAEKQKELQSLKESLDKQNPLLNPEARATKEKEFQSKESCPVRPIPAYKAGLYGLTENRQLSNASSKPAFIPVHRMGFSASFNKLREFQRWGEDNQNEINQKRMELERNISTSLLKVIRKIGADEGYVLILEKNENIVLFGSKSIDLTDRVIKAYDLQKK